MNIERKLETTYPYPERPSELVSDPEFVESLKVEPIPLTEEEKKELSDFDKNLYEEYKEAKKGIAGNHVIYPSAFISPEGQRLFASTYLDTTIWKQSRKMIRELKLKKKDQNKVYDALYEDLQGISTDPEKYEEFTSEGASFERFSEALGKEVKFQINPEVDPEELDEERIFKNFGSLDLRRIPSRIRKVSNDYSSNVAREEFKEKFREKKGFVNSEEAPRRIGKVVSPQKLANKLEKLRAQKVKLKETKREFVGEENNLGEAKRIVTDLYQRKINIEIAGLYSTARLVGDSPGGRGPGRRAALSEVSSISPRSMERIDHFLNGVGLSIDDDGMFFTIPRKLSEVVEKNIRKSKETSPEYEKYNSIKIDAEGMKEICNQVIAEYGWDKNKKPWGTEITKLRKTMAVNNTKRLIRIPKNYNTGLIDALSVASHEIEGHAIRDINNLKAKQGELKIVNTLSGRSGLLSESAAVGVENKTKLEMVGVEKTSGTFYYQALREKEKGGDFASVFNVFFEEVARRKYGATREEWLSDEEKYNEIFEYSYPRALRIFRNHTPLEDSSGYVPASDQLEYAEQELVGEALLTEEARLLGLDNLLYVKGIDLYSMYDLQRLGVLDLEKVEKPQMVVARKLWPKIKEKLDSQSI